MPFRLPGNRAANFLVLILACIAHQLPPVSRRQFDCSSSYYPLLPPIMSGMEVVAVVACVAGVVSAYKDGGRLVKQIKAKRAAKRAPAPTESLETSLQKGPPAVEGAKDQGIEKYGPRFADSRDRECEASLDVFNLLISNPAIAVDALRDILIHLQGTLLKHLWLAQEDDNIQDFNIVVETSDHGRIRSVMVLNELYMRMAQAAPLQRELSMPSRVQTLDSIADSRLPWDRQDHPSYDAPNFPTSSVGLQTQSHPSTHNTPSLQDYIVNPGTGVEGKPARRWFHASRTGKGQENSIQSDTNTSGQNDTASAINMSGNSLRMRPNGVASPRRSTSLGETEGTPQIQQHHSADAFLPLTWQQSPELSSNPWASEESSSSNVDYAALSSSPNLNQGFQHLRSGTGTGFEGSPPLVHSSKISTPDMQSKTVAFSSSDNKHPARDAKHTKIRMPTWPRKRSSTEATQLSENGSLSQDSGRNGSLSPPNPQGRPPLESSTTGTQNLFGGFCLGAYKLQVGFPDEGFKLRNQSVALTGQSQYWACANPHCVFDGPARKMDKGWGFSTVIKVAFGVQYRWTFLAKSHVALSKSKNREFDYQCPFCVAQRQPPGPYRTVPAFMEHVSTHRGQEPESSIYDKINCVFGRVAQTDEAFDINLTPYGIAHAANARVLEQSFATSLSL